MDDILAAALGCGLVLCLVAWIRSRRALVRRLAAVTVRLAHDPGSQGEVARRRRGLEGVLARLEHASEEATALVTDAAGQTSRIQHTLDTIDDAIVILDGEGQVVLCNPRGGALLEDCPSGGEPARELDRVVRTALGGEPCTGEVRVSGRSVDARFMVTAMPVDDGHRFVGAVLVARDLSEIDRLHTARRQFFADVVDLMEKPVGTIAVLATTLVEESEPRVVARLGRRLDDEARGLSRVVADLIELGRLEAMAAAALEPVTVRAVVAQAVARSQALAEERGVQVSIEESSGRLRVLGSRRHLMVAVQHLIENAVLRSGKGQTVELSMATSGPSLDIVVRDHSAPLADTEYAPGCELRLRIARRVAELHHGEVRVRSGSGGGAVSALRLPRDTTPAVPARRAS